MTRRFQQRRSRHSAGLEPDALLADLNDRQRGDLATWQGAVERAPGWCGTLPVALWERAWLRLSAVPVATLARVLPPDSSGEAPELVRYRELVRAGLSGWQAEQQCWLEFGSEACQQALRRHWQAQEQDRHRWTLRRYLQLVDCYRRQLEPGAARQLPLLVLGRPGSGEPHALLWLRGSRPPMRHTCA